MFGFIKKCVPTAHSTSERTPLLPPRDPGGFEESSDAKRARKRAMATATSSKLGTFAGVFVPTTLNVLSILMFLRFGFILGQTGVLGMIFMLFTCYVINLITTLSVSAIASNGTVRGGGAYYLISRSLGPEFGGSVGLVLYLGFTFNTGLNAVGMVDCLAQDFGTSTGSWANWLADGYWWRYLWGSMILLFCTAICLAGSGLFAKCSNALLAILLISTFSIPVSTLIVRPFEQPKLGITYTGLSFTTLKDNLLPHLTKGAAGSQLNGPETYQDLFGILFPATAGIFAGASMSGDLRNPSRSIPKGTLYGLLLTFFTYFTVIVAMAASITRETFYQNANALENVNVSKALILLGEVATSLFSVLMGVIGSAKLLQALARDNLLPGLLVFGQGTKQHDEPILAIFLTYLVAQLTMLSNINQIATIVTMTYLVTFLVVNLACLLLKLSSAPNFRPSFKYFSTYTAAAGTILSAMTMFFIDIPQASGSLFVLAIVFVTIHYSTSPKSWGDVSQSLIYHQVRKCLLRLSRSDHHVKYWRPQILLFVNDPRRSFKLIQFCNSLKKGSLFILGHVIVTQDFADAVPEATKQQTAWTKYIDFSKIKAFVNVAISPGIEWGVRNVVLNSGLGSMRPNIIVMGFFNLEEHRQQQSPAQKPPDTSEFPPLRLRESRSRSVINDLPTDENRSETAASVRSYVTILEDLILRIKANVAIARGFSDFNLPPPTKSTAANFKSFLDMHNRNKTGSGKASIDLWPIQMSAEISTETLDGNQNILTTNFDTYALILQMGCILHTVDSYQLWYKLRVMVFVEYESDVEEERGRVESLLSNLRMEAEVVVLWLADGRLSTYEIIVNGSEDKAHAHGLKRVESALKEEDWWLDIKSMRESGMTPTLDLLANTNGLSRSISRISLADGVSDTGGSSPQAEQSAMFDWFMHTMRRKPSISNLSRLGINFSMQTHRLGQALTEEQVSSESSGSDDGNSINNAFESTPASRRNSFVVRHPSLYDEDQSFTWHNGFSEASFSSLTHSSTDADMDPALTSEIDDPPGGRPPALPNLLSNSTSSYTGENLRSLNPRAETLPSELLPEAPNLISSQHPPRPQLQPTSTSKSGRPLHSVPFPKTSFESQNPAPAGITIYESKSSPRNLPEPAKPTSESSNVKLSRPFPRRLGSKPMLTSALVPRPVIAEEDTAGPSITFSMPSPPARDTGINNTRGRSIYERNNASNTRSASARSPGSIRSDTSKSTFAASQPLSFNNLPCRAQHLIINELMRQHSGPRYQSQTESFGASPMRSDSGNDESDEDDNIHHDRHATSNNNNSQNRNTSTSSNKATTKSHETAVIFTTLPAPIAGTCESHEDSLSYLTNLETLCQGLPPVLMVHSNSVSVTMSL